MFKFVNILFIIVFELTIEIAFFLPDTKSHTLEPLQLHYKTTFFSPAIRGVLIILISLLKIN